MFIYWTQAKHIFGVQETLLSVEKLYAAYLFILW